MAPKSSRHCGGKSLSITSSWSTRYWGMTPVSQRATRPTTSSSDRLSRLPIKTAKVFQPLLAPARDKAAWGGRGSGKSHFFAGLMVEDSLAHPGAHGGEGLRSVCIREVQKDLAQSSKLLIESKLAACGLGEANGFKIYRDVIRTPGDGLIAFRGMQDATAESIKSLEGFKRSWW